MFCSLLSAGIALMWAGIAAMAAVGPAAARVIDIVGVPLIAEVQ